MSVPGEVRFCPSCGAGVTPGSVFCSRCGKPLPIEVPSAPEAPVEAETPVSAEALFTDEAPGVDEALPPSLPPAPNRMAWWVWGAAGLVALAGLAVVLVLVLGGRGGPAVTTSYATLPTSGARAILADGTEVAGASAAEAGETAPAATIEHAVPVSQPALFPSQEGSVTLSLPYEAGQVPSSPGSDPVLFAAFYDEAAAGWVPIPGTAVGGVVTAEADHLSWWAAWAWDLQALSDALAGGVEGYLQGTGVPVATLTPCGEAPEGVTVASEEPPLVTACAEFTGGDLVRVRVANSGGYGVLLGLPEAVAVEAMGGGTLPGWLTTWVDGLTPAGSAYLPPGAEGSLLVDLGQSSQALVPVGQAPATVVADFLGVACGASNGLCAAVGNTPPTATCLLIGLDRAGSGATFSDLAAAAEECTATTVPGAATVFGYMAGADGGETPVADWIDTHHQTLTVRALPAGAFPVDEIDACVVGVDPGDQADVNAAPDSGSGLVGTLAEDATGVHTTGWAVDDSAGAEWRQILLGDATGWIASHLLTQGACTVAESVEYCVVVAACDDPPNVRTGLGTAYDIFATLPVDATGVAGTGVTALDSHDRTWIQVDQGGRNGWVAGWLLTPAPCSAASCSGHPLVLYPDGIDTWRFGDSGDEVVMGLTSRLGPPDASADDPITSRRWVTWEDLSVAVGIGDQETAGFTGYIVGLGPAPHQDWRTPQSLLRGSTQAAMESAYPDGQYVDECVPVYEAPASAVPAGHYYRFYYQAGTVIGVGAGTMPEC
jgi:uncharacterized protein YgiM (DUF1202 family)